MYFFLYVLQITSIDDSIIFTQLQIDIIKPQKKSFRSREIWKLDKSAFKLVVYHRDVINSTS